MHKLTERLSKLESQNSRPRASMQQSWRAAAGCLFAKYGVRGDSLTTLAVLGAPSYHTAVFAYDSPTIFNAAPCFFLGGVSFCYLFIFAKLTFLIFSCPLKGTGLEQWLPG